MRDEVLKSYLVGYYVWMEVREMNLRTGFIYLGKIHVFNIRFTKWLARSASIYWEDILLYH